MIAPSVLLQHVAPQHLLSRLAGAVAECTWPWVRLPLISLFIRIFNVNMEEAAREQAADYESFNDFFTRQLKGGLRPIAEEESALISPVDGTVSQMGLIDGDQILQAKGISYSVQALLGDADGSAEAFRGGSFATLYLSPRDYHRIHAPISGRLVRSSYLPGTLFSVDDTTARNVPNLYTRNERLAAIFETEIGRVAIVMVGAMIVAGISTAWHAKPYPPRHSREDSCDGTLQYPRGEEIGRFRLGSTVVILTPPGTVSWLDEMVAGRAVRMGECIGQISSAISAPMRGS